MSTVKRKPVPINFKRVPEDIDPWFKLALSHKKWDEYLAEVQDHELSLKQNDADHFILSLRDELSWTVKKEMSYRTQTHDGETFRKDLGYYLTFSGMTAVDPKTGKRHEFVRSNCKFGSGGWSCFPMQRIVWNLVQRLGYEELGGVRVDTLRVGTHASEAL